MKKIYLAITVLAICLFTSCTNNYGLVYGLGNSLDNVEESLKEAHIEYEHDIDKENGNIRTIEAKRAEFDSITYNEIELVFYKEKVVGLRYNVIREENVEKVLALIKEKYGEPTTKNELVKRKFSDYYWGDMNSKFMIIQKYSSRRMNVYMMNAGVEDAVLSTKLKSACFEMKK